MPAWTVAELPDAPKFSWRDWAGLIGPGLVMGGAAIGGGEWITGPKSTAMYGGAVLWLATLSILGQVIYNFEISRYTLYTGEPIFTGKFRVPPGPLCWLVVYLILDMGSFFPYLAQTAAQPAAAVLLGHVANEKAEGPASVFGIPLSIGARPITERDLLQILSYVMFIAGVIPLMIGGKVYNSVRILMSVKVFVVLGFLLFLAVFFSKPATWIEIGSGFFKIGSVPVRQAADPNQPGGVDSSSPNTENVIWALLSGKSLPDFDLKLLGVLTAMAAISGSGGLTNTTVSAYTRDQGWGMGSHVGAIPSMVGGHDISLSHSGTVFKVTMESLARWKRWLRHVARDQLVVWGPACFVGIALPSMLSVQFLARGTEVPESQVASKTAEGVQAAVAAAWGSGMGTLFFYFTLACGVLVLLPSNVTTIDGFLRRWVELIWTAVPGMRKVSTKQIGRVYFGVLCLYIAFGLASLTFLKKPELLLTIATTFYNFAIAMSCFQTLVLNTTLLPKELRPGQFNRVSLVLAGVFFFLLGILGVVAAYPKIKQLAFPEPAVAHVVCPAAHVAYPAPSLM